LFEAFSTKFRSLESCTGKEPVRTSIFVHQQNFVEKRPVMSCAVMITSNWGRGMDVAPIELQNSRKIPLPRGSKQRLL